ncbi:peptide-methionine (R)-S-oxide reductase [Pseudochelatococcus lubricantis]|uniref:peptide-methionine (R)-S-oxide reductase n=1 Tax=Pseudochelatococcus lubricantis TaxID=1538102 RepID=A0ABX0V3L9_9HYPH|nr:peptide-methionine (R)-S-oxide reductase MsrB [Pseudochelatococcus lubricantis]NIJ58689.1 peptide-methionine (R)-S-oxide reductase [Pseudochelatococcus lubricantis]
MAISRRYLLGAAAVLGGAAVSWRLTAPTAARTPEEAFPFSLTDAQWRARLSAAQYSILRGHGTEQAFTSPLNDEHREGAFNCAGCDVPLFSSTTKFDSHTGWPSFWQPLEQAVGTRLDTSYGMVRTEVHCRRCGGHLGHVFNDGPPPTGLRYCINGLALTFAPAGA